MIIVVDSCGMGLHSSIFAPVLPVQLVWVKTIASPPAAGGGVIPSRIGMFEYPVLLAVPTLKPNYNDDEDE